MTTENRFSCLTEPELQVVREVVAGYTLRETAAKLGITESTVQHRLCSIYDKLGVSSRLELAHLLLSHPLP